MSSAELVRKVLLNEYRELTIEDLDDGGAVVRDTSTPQPATASETGGFPVTAMLYRCADLLADSGFAVALVRDAKGVYLNAR